MGRSLSHSVVFTTLLLFVCSVGWAQPPQSSEQNREIEGLVKQLTSDVYALRQAAWQTLRELGAGAELQLEAALVTDDREARERIRMLLTASKMRVAPDASNQLIELLSQFGELPEVSQQEFLQSLVQSGHLRLALDVLLQLPDKVTALKLQQSSFVMNSALAGLATKADSRAVSELLIHPFVREHYPELCLSFWRVAGRLPEEIEGVLIQAGLRNLTIGELQLLIRGLNALGRDAEALNWIERIEDSKVRQTSRDALHLNQANWQYFWDQQKDFQLPDATKLAKLSEVNEEVKELQLRFLLARFLHRTEDYEIAKACIAKTLEAIDTKTAETTVVADCLIRSLLINGETDLALAYLEKNDKATALKVANYLLPRNSGLQSRCQCN